MTMYEIIESQLIYDIFDMYCLMLYAIIDQFRKILIKSLMTINHVITNGWCVMNNIVNEFLCFYTFDLIE